MLLPEELPGIVKLARECALLGDYEASVRHFERALECAKKQAEDCRRIMKTMVQDGESSVSVETWKKLTVNLQMELNLALRGKKMFIPDVTPKSMTPRRIGGGQPPPKHDGDSVPLWKQQAKQQPIAPRRDSNPSHRNSNNGGGAGMKPRRSQTPTRNPKKSVPMKKASAALSSDERPAYSEVMEHSPDIELIRTIESTLLTRCPDVKTDDIAGLDNAKAVLEEAVLYPQLMPQYYTGIRRPWKGVLLFGPPGTGKTMLAKAIATECNTCFFNVGSSSIASKWRGESEKMVSILFDMARYYAPSTIFFDEVDSVASARGGSSEHEASRRVKSELLTQMDGVSSGEDKTIVVLAATNLPWELDDAIRRRLEKRIYIPLPAWEDRIALFKLATDSIQLETDVDFGELADNTEGYSGADITNVCHEASMMPIRRLIDDAKQAAIRAGGGRDEIHRKMKELSENQPQSPPVHHADFLEAINKVSSSVGGKDLSRYQEWLEEYGAT